MTLPISVFVVAKFSILTLYVCFKSIFCSVIILTLLVTFPLFISKGLIFLILMPSISIFRSLILNGKLVVTVISLKLSIVAFELIDPKKA